MENKKVGWIIIGIAVVMTIIVLLFNMAMKDIVALSCTHGAECTMYDTIRTQTGISLSLIGIIIIIGIVIMTSKPKEKVIVKKVKERKKKIKLKGIEKDEKKVVDLLMKENKAMFQRDLMEKLSIGKVKTTRLLDKLESKGIVERKRRGMNNIVVLKEWKMRLILVRHWETEENKRREVQGHKHGKLSSLGIKQAKRVAQRLKKEKINFIFSSDLARASDTAKEIHKFHPKTPIKFVKELRKWNLKEE